jgi:hypothetical protein
VGSAGDRGDALLAKPCDLQTIATRIHSLTELAA